MEVDQNFEIRGGQASRALFSKILTKPLEFASFAQIHSTHHNNKLYSFLNIQEHLVVMSCCCGGKCKEIGSGSHLFPQRRGMPQTLYFTKKRVQYGSGRN